MWLYVETGIFSFSVSELQNAYGTLHGGAVGSLVEVLSTACARTVVAEDKELFLGEISISYLSGTPINVSSCFHWWLFPMMSMSVLAFACFQVCNRFTVCQCEASSRSFVMVTRSKSNWLRFHARYCYVSFLHLY